MRHFASPDFWAAYRKLPEAVRNLADKNFALLKSEPRHPSLHFKKVGKLSSARVGLHYRALAPEVDGDLVWFWIGSHAEYDRLMNERGRQGILDHAGTVEDPKAFNVRCSGAGTSGRSIMGTMPFSGTPLPSSRSPSWPVRCA